MNILINLQSSERNSKDKFHGGNEYAVRISFELIRNNTRLLNRLYFYGTSEDSLPESLLGAITQDTFAEYITMSEYRKLSQVIRRFKIDRLFDPLGINLGLEKIKFPEVVYTLHGLRPLEIPTDINEYFLESKVKHILKKIFKKGYRNAVRKNISKTLNLDADRKTLVVVSNHTKNVLNSEFGYPLEGIKVCYSPEKISPKISLEQERKFFSAGNHSQPSEYFLIVSSGRWIKNSYRAIKALDEIYSERRSRIKTVLTGSTRETESIIKNREMFILLDYVEPEILEILYKNSFALIYPSLNEGFGYPPLEAMKYKIPVIASMISSVPEILGDAFLGFNPFSILELKAMILLIQNDQNLYNQLKEKSVKRSREIGIKQREDLNNLILAILT